MSDTNTGLTFPGEQRRKRIQIGNGAPANGATESQTLPTAPVLVAVDEEVEQAALRFSTLAGNIKKERDSMREERDTALARVEQFEKSQTRILNDLDSERLRHQSELESARAETAAAKEEAELARADKVRLETVLAGIRNQANDALPQE